MRLCQVISVGLVLAVSGCSLTGQTISGGAAPPAAKITRASTSGTLTTLYSFQGQPDGANPQGSADAFTFCTGRCATRIYGNTSSGGTNDAGTIYTISGPYQQGPYTEKVLLSYTPSVNGSDPTGAILARSYNVNEPIFGTASRGGPHHNGTVIELYQVEPRVLSFDGHNGAKPSAGLSYAPEPNTYYATTFEGGRQSRGAIVSIRTTHQKLVPKVVYSFSGKGDGEHPNSAITADGFVGSPYFGTTAGSKSAPGTVYAFVPGQGLTTLYTFSSSADGLTPDGVFPAGGYTSVKKIRLFGTTLKGGSSGYGTLYTLTSNGSTYTKTTLHTFAGGSSDGAFPQGTLVFISPSLYGVTNTGGSGGCGTIFSVDTASGKYSSRYSFTCGDDGAHPEAPLSLSRNDFSGTLYGTTSAGGTANKGVVFSYKP